MLTTLVPDTVLLIAVALVGVFGFTRPTQTLIQERDSELVQLAARQVAGYWEDSIRLLTQVASLASGPIYDLRGQFSGCVLGVWELQGDRLGLPVARVRVGESGFALRDTD